MPASSDVEFQQPLVGFCLRTVVSHLGYAWKARQCVGYPACNDSRTGDGLEYALVGTNTLAYRLGCALNLVKMGRLD